MVQSRAYLSPGLFGFHQIGTYAYFKHFERALIARHAEAGRDLRVHLVESAPTASIRHRALLLLSEIERTAGADDVLHLIGHSTGGLDVRLLVSPAVDLSPGRSASLVRPRVRSVTTMNTPHYGTPLAAFFTTVSGQRLLYALSALTVLVLKLGAPPLAVTSSLVATLGRLDRAFGLEVGLLDRMTETVVRMLDDASSRDLRLYLGRLRDDQGGLLQVSPESMDIFQASVQDDPNLYYQCTASYAPSQTLLRLARSLTSPLTGPSAMIFATLYRLTAIQPRTYPCGPASASWDRTLIDVLGQIPAPGANDGVVPFRSQLRGRLVWAGQGDHLDVVGHFAGGKKLPEHNDWLASGARFGKKQFDAMVDAIARGMLESEKR